MVEKLIDIIFGSFIPEQPVICLRKTSSSYPSILPVLLPSMGLKVELELQPANSQLICE
jgi:hypothetical protein